MIAPVSFGALLFGASLVAAQASTLEIEYEQANFEQSQIVPDMLSSFNPSAVLDVSFSSEVSYGQALTIDEVKTQPTITVNPASNATDAFGSDDVFTVAMVDPGVVGASQTDGQTRHWLVNNVRLSGDSAPYSLNFTTDAITAYGGPYPAEGSGPHRYTILLMPQPSTFSAPEGLNTPNVTISTMDFPGYISSTGLGAPVAGFYFTVEQGTTTSSIASTTAVASSTLAAVASSASSSVASSTASGMSASSSASKSASGSGTVKSIASSASAAASSAVNTSAGPKTASIGAAALVGALGLVGASFL